MSRWAQALAIVEPDTVVRWHRAEFRIYWNWLSRRGKRSVSPPLPREVRCSVTASPTAAWVAQQLRETFPFESAPRFMIFDRDALFSAGLTAGSRRDLSEQFAGNFSIPSSS